MLNEDCYSAGTRKSQKSATLYVNHNQKPEYIHRSLSKPSFFRLYILYDVPCAALSSFHTNLSRQGGLDSMIASVQLLLTAACSANSRELKVRRLNCQLNETTDHAD